MRNCLTWLTLTCPHIVPQRLSSKSTDFSKNLRKNKDIVILQPDKGNGVVVFDRTAYDRGILKIINDTSKFKPLSNDPTLNREGKLQRCLRDLKKKGHLDQEIYDAIYPSGSQPARIHGLPKMHKPRATLHLLFVRLSLPLGHTITTWPNFLVIFSSRTFPLNMLLQTRSLLHVREINGLSMEGKFMVSFDVETEVCLPTFL